jgi:hypothetical protein
LPEFAESFAICFSGSGGGVNIVKGQILKSRQNPGANPTIVIYIQRQRCNNLQMPSNLVRFENKTIFYYFEKSLYPTYHNVGVEVVNLNVVGLALGVNFMKGCQGLGIEPGFFLSSFLSLFH